MSIIRVLKKKVTGEIRNLSISYEEFCDTVSYEEFCDTDKLSYILANPLIAKASSKICHLILERRRAILNS